MIMDLWIVLSGFSWLSLLLAYYSHLRKSKKEVSDLKTEHGAEKEDWERKYKAIEDLVKKLSD